MVTCNCHRKRFQNVLSTDISNFKSKTINQCLLELHPKQSVSLGSRLSNRWPRGFMKLRTNQGKRQRVADQYRKEELARKTPNCVRNTLNVYVNCLFNGYNWKGSAELILPAGPQSDDLNGSYKKRLVSKWGAHQTVTAKGLQHCSPEWGVTECRAGRNFKTSVANYFLRSLLCVQHVSFRLNVYFINNYVFKHIFYSYFNGTLKIL